MEFATIGTALSSRRKALNIDQARAAAIIGMSRTTFSSYERDLQRPSAEVLPSLAQFLDISLEDILTLYGGTCIAALRPALEQFLATHDPKDQPPMKDVVSLTPAPSSGDSVTANAGLVASATDPVDSDAPTLPAPDSVSSAVRAPAVASGAPVSSPLDPDASTARDTPVGAAKDSVSIFANELSDDVARPSASPSISLDSDRPDPKATKGKGGKKKKGKKGKRAKP
jgi:transcriptional regulator with XRE-family HTH domain